MGKTAVLFQTHYFDRWAERAFRELRADAPPPEPEPVRVFDMRHPDPAMGELEMAGAATDGPGGVPGYSPLPPRPVADGVDPSDPTTWARTPRNAPCPCSSGKKFKHCHGRAD